MYNYSFECDLDNELPTSIEAGFGSIRYFTRVVLDILHRPSKAIVQPFSVIKPFDLNIDPMFRVIQKT